MPPSQDLKKVGDEVEKDEIERWWIPGSLSSGLNTCRREMIRQFYTKRGRANTVTRFRLQCHEYVTVQKTGHGLVRREKTKRISKKKFLTSRPDRIGQVIIKYRHYWPVADGLVYEIDVFAGALKGRVKIEVEFTSVDQAQNFQPPAWFGREVTGDSRYGNFSLATIGWPPEDSPR